MLFYFCDMHRYAQALLGLISLAPCALLSERSGVPLDVWFDRAIASMWGDQVVSGTHHRMTVPP